MHMKLWGEMISYSCPATTTPLQNQYYLKANTDKSGGEKIMSSAACFAIFPSVTSHVDL